MKRFFLGLIIACIFINLPVAKAVETSTGVSFIYINGSNNLAYKNLNHK